VKFSVEAGILVMVQQVALKVDRRLVGRHWVGAMSA
jgi:hypothetical protein